MLLYVCKQTFANLRVYNSRVFRIKTVKFSGYHFYMNPNIYGYFQICISVPLRKKQIASAKKFSFVLINLTRMSLSWMAFETSSTFISVRTSSLETKLKEKFALFLYSDAIARILGWFLHLAIAFRVRSSIFSAKELQFS